MRSPASLLLGAAILLPLGACAGGPSSGAPGRDPTVISFAEIEETEAETAYQLVQQLRPRWMMRNRGSRTFVTGEASPRIVVDDLPPREFDFLMEIPRTAVQEIRYLDPREATFLYGTGFSAGVLKIITRR